MDKTRRQALAACYGAGEIKQGLIAGEYPPPDVLARLDLIGVVSQQGTITGRFSSTKGNLVEVERTETWKPRVEGEEPPW